MSDVTKHDDDEVTTGRAATLSTDFTRLVGVEYPIVQTGMGWVSGPELTAATANAGGLGIIASATLTYAELEDAIVRTKKLTSKPFGVNLRADAEDAGERCELMIRHGVKVASFALAPKPELIARLKEHGIVVMPSIGAAKHAVKLRYFSGITYFGIERDVAERNELARLSLGGCGFVRRRRRFLFDDVLDYRVPFAALVTTSKPAA